MGQKAVGVALFTSNSTKFLHVARADLLFALMYASAIAYGTLLPFRFRQQTVFGACSELIERAAIDYGEFAQSDILINLVLYIPLGFFWMNYWRRRLRPLSAMIASLVSCIGLSFALEFVQAWQATRFGSAFDIMINSIGSVHGILGAVLYAILCRATYRHIKSVQSKRLPLRRKDRAYIWRAIVICYAIVLLRIFLRPFDLDVSITAVYESLQHLFSLPFVELQRRSYSVALVLIAQKIFLFFPLGALFILGVFTSPRTARERNRAVVAAFVSVVVFAVVIEFGQAFLRGRYPASSDVVLYVTGAWLGAYAALRLVIGFRFRQRNALEIA